MKYLLISIMIFTACRNKTNGALIKSALDEAILQKDTDSIAFARFKMENANQFKAFDSLTKIHQITAELQNIHDSLVQSGVNLAMKFIRDQMKINDLKKEPE
jgi:hypothetical protein